MIRAASQTGGRADTRRRRHVGRRHVGRRHVGRRWSAAGIGVIAIIVVGAIGTGVAWASERARVAQQDGQYASVAAAAISDRLARSTTALAGVDGLAADGAVSELEFTTYATRVLSGGVLPSLGWVVLVDDADRAAFESRTGRPIIERDATGGFVPAQHRQSYAVVVDVVPKNEITRATLGFDITSDPARATAAAQAAGTQHVVLSEPVKLAPSGRAGFFLIQPIFGPDATGSSRLLGYVSTGLLAEVLLTAARAHLPAGISVGIQDGSHPPVNAVADPSGSAELTVDGRTWRITVDNPVGPDLTVPALLASTTLLFVAFGATLAYRESRLQRQVSENAARAERMADVAQRLSAVEHLDDVVRIIEAELPGVVGADVADIGLILDGESLNMLAGAERAGLSPDLIGRYRRVSLTDHLPTTEALRLGHTVLVDDLASFHRDDPDRLPDVASSGLRAAAAAPIADANGAHVGVLVLAWREPVNLDPSLASAISTLAELCGQTLERTLAADRRYAFIVALQRRLLPDLPTVEGLRIIARYQPAAGVVGMGGDWYQFLRPRDGSLVVVIGDVAGHGVEAIATMTQIQYVIAAAVHTGVSLSQVFSYVSTALEQSEPAFASALLLHIDAAGHRLGYVSAGHPYALIRRPDGTTTALDRSQQPLLGVARTSAPLTYVDLPVGSTILAYTDGLIERRNRPITTGIEHLRTEFSTLDSDLDRGLDKLIASSLHLTSAADGVDDDVAVVLVHHT